MSGELLKNLEYRFHKATLETYDEVVTGLTTVARYLIEVCFTFCLCSYLPDLCSHSVSLQFLRRNSDVAEANTLQSFLCEVYQCEDSNVAFQKAGITG